MPPFPVDIRGQAFQGYQTAPFQTPGGAFGRSLVRGNVPGASFFADRPQAPSMGGWPGMMMKVLSGLPFIGSLFSAANASGGQQEMLSRQENLAKRLGGLGVDPGGEGYLSQPESMLSRGWSTLGAGLKWAPGGPIVDPLRMGYNVVQGLRGAGDFASRSFPDFAAGTGGTMGGILANRMGWGIPSSPMYQEEQPQWQDNTNNFAFQGPRDFEQERVG